MSPKTEDFGWAFMNPHTHAYLAPAIISLLKEEDVRTVLDAGCGKGTLAGQLAASGFDITGIDGDRMGIAIARQGHPEVSFLVGRFDESPPGIFDAVCSTEVIEHLYSPHELATYCFDALKPGGILVISTPYHGYLKNLALSLLGKWDRHFTALWHGGHIKFWSRETLTHLLEQCGFEVVRFVGAGRTPLFWKSMILVARRPIDQSRIR